MTVQIVDDAVVVHDIQLIVREQDGKKEIEFLLAGISGILLSAQFSHTHSGGTAVMAVRNIYAVDVCECLSYRGAVIRIGNDPDTVADISFRDKITDRSAGCRLFHDGINRVVSVEAEEDRTGLSTAGVHMTDPVLLLFCARVLMFLDNALIIIIDRSACDDPGLGPVAHGLCINIVTGSLVLDKTAFTDPGMQQFSCARIDAPVIYVHILRECRLCTVDRKKGTGVSGYIFSRFST